MNIEEMKKIWDSENQQMMYAFDEQSLFDSIKRKSKAASKQINFVEKGLMVINFVVATIVLIDYLKGSDEGLWDLWLSLAIYGTVAFLYFFRTNRKSKDESFDRSMLGELNHAISNTEHMIKISGLMITGYFLPILIFCIGKMIYFNASIEKWLLILGAFCLSYFLVIWERKRMHLPRKRRFESMRDKLVRE